MPRLIPAAAIAALASTLAFASTQNEAPKPLAFRADARIEVDADGKLVKAQVQKGLPESVRHYIGQQLATWKYKPRHRNGESGIVATWVSLGVCAVPSSNGYTMGLVYQGTGPRVADGETWTIPQGLARSIARSDFSGEIKVGFVVAANGKATIESIEGFDDRTRRMLRSEIAYMFTFHRFDPEAVDGRPVATRETLSLRVKQGRTAGSYEIAGTKPLMESPQCKAAVASGMSANTRLRPVAVDSVIEIEPSF